MTKQATVDVYPLCPAEHENMRQVGVSEMIRCPTCQYTQHKDAPVPYPPKPVLTPLYEIHEDHGTGTKRTYKHFGHVREEVDRQGALMTEVDHHARAIHVSPAVKEHLDAAAGKELTALEVPGHRVVPVYVSTDDAAVAKRGVILSGTPPTQEELEMRTWNTEPHLCPLCDGEGRRRLTNENKYVECTHCNGKGQVHIPIAPRG